MSRPEFDAAVSAFVAAIPAARAAEGMSCRELGRQIGLDASAVTRTEKGSRRLTLADAVAISSVLGISLPASLSGATSESLAYIRAKRAASDLVAMAAEFEDLRDLLAPNADGGAS